MNGTLSFLNDLAQWLGRWIPRLVLIEPTHLGVLFGPRGDARQVGPGLIWYWPITHALVNVPVTTQSLQLSSQILPNDADVDDGLLPRVLLCAAAVQFRTFDAVKVATKALHTHALVDNRASAAIARHVSHRKNLANWAEAVVADLAGELAPFGVVVDRLDFTQHGSGVALKNISDWNYADAAAGTRPKE